MSDQIDDSLLDDKSDNTAPTDGEEVISNGLAKKGEPSLKLKAMLEGLEMFSAKRNSAPSFSLADLNEGQRDKVLDIVAKNEDNAYKYHTKKLEVLERLNSKQIDASTIGRRNVRYIVYAAIATFLILTIVIIFYKSEFFVPWLTFLTGLAGGFGLSKVKNGLTKEPKLSDPTKNEEDEEDE
jgi:hypothetical protein